MMINIGRFTVKEASYKQCIGWLIYRRHNPLNISIPLCRQELEA